MSDTIAAIATGYSSSAIGIIRISGDDSLKIAQSVFIPRTGEPLSKIPDRTLVLGSLIDAKGDLLDNCLCTVSRSPNSYTGENTAEFHCHGSPTVLRLSLESLFAAGARQALPGEFTKRAFINGKMDLTQAEAVIDLIDAETQAAAKNAAAQLGGAIQKKISGIYDELVDIISHYHAVLDYPDEDIEPFEISKYRKYFAAAAGELHALLESFEHGKVMKNGVKAAIVGRPNVGKSSLLNALLGYERAIVTDTPGTTRDTIEESLLVGGVKLRLIDTAGLRGTSDSIEKMGVDRARLAVQDADLIIAVFDGSQVLTFEDQEAIEASKLSKPSIAVVNKQDLQQNRVNIELFSGFDRICLVSALDKTGLDELGRAVGELFPAPEVPAGEILTNSRQANAVDRALVSVTAALDSLDAGHTPDIVLTETENAIAAIGELSGKTVRDDVTKRIFERFCVGK